MRDSEQGAGRPSLRDRRRSRQRAEWPQIAKTVLALLNPRTELDVQQLDDCRPGVHDLVTSIRSVAGDSTSSAGRNR